MRLQKLLLGFCLCLFIIIPFNGNCINVPFGFLPNNGQLVYDNGSLAEDVLFYNNFGSIKILFKKDRITYLIEKPDPEFRKHFEYLKDHDKDSAKRYELTQYAYFYRIDMVFENSLPKVEIKSSDPSSHTFNFYQGHCPEGILNVPAYGVIKYSNVWNNIDLVFYANEGNIKYDIILHPGANPSDVVFLYEGAEHLEISSGELHIHNPVINWSEYIPNSFIKDDQEEARQVEVYYKTEGNRVMFQTPEDLKANETLIIDPVMTWSTYFNFKQNGIWDADLAGAGDRVIYMTRTEDNTISVTQAGTGAYLQTSRGGTSDLIFLMFNNDGVLLWATFYGGSDTEYLKGGIQIAPSGQIYAVAMTSSANFPVQSLSGAFNLTTKIGYFEDLVILRFNNNGVREWSTFYDMDYYASNAAMDVGPNGHLFITGYFELSYRFGATMPMINPGGGAYFQSTKSSVVGDNGFDHESFMLEFNTNGAVVWSTYFGSNGQERLKKIRVAPNGSIICYGTAQTKVTSSPAATHQPKLLSAGQYYDNVITGLPEKLYIVKFDNNRTWRWGTLYGGTTGNGNHPPGDKLNICVDSLNNVYFVGGTRMTNFPLYNPGGGAYFDNTFSGDPAWDSNMYILKFSNTTQRLWATLYGGSGWHARPGCTVCSLDNLYVTSSTDAADHPVLDKPGSYFQPNSAGGKDGHMGEFTSAGVLTWSTYVGGFNTDEELNCLAALDGPCGGQVFAFGRTGGTASPCTSSWPIVDPGGGAHIQTYPCVSYYQVAISKFDTNPPTGPPGLWTWLGGINKDWFEPCNWDKKTVPISTSNVLIPGGTPFQPTISGATGHCNVIEIVSTNGAILTIEQTLLGELEVHQ